ncbi:aldehyde dehydrogenase family protein [Rhodococcus opacus]|nr:aldehyde dehydrogenase family protein [Rhodococcus opacus]
MTALQFTELACEAGLPNGVLNIVAGFGGSRCRTRSSWGYRRRVLHTGSGPAGRHFLRYAADSNINRVSLGLGVRVPDRDERCARC